MARVSSQKMKLLYILKMLTEKTDEESPMTVSDIISELNLYGISAERKSIYDDLEALSHFGIDIITRRSHTTEYFIGKRTFEIAELKLLVDAVQCSKFITHKKSNELIKKLEGLASYRQAQTLQRQVYVSNRVKTVNESIYYNVDCLHTAISMNKKVKYKYFDFSITKDKVFRKNGESYLVSPYGLSWDDENYYMVAYSSKYTDFIHYRVDRMTGIEITDEDRDPLPKNGSFDIAEYTNKLFSMFGGSEVRVLLQFEKDLINSVMDRFGQDITIEKKGDSHFQVRVSVVVSAQFYSWIMQFGSKVRIISPDDVVAEYLLKMQEIQQLYQ